MQNIWYIYHIHYHPLINYSATLWLHVLQRSLHCKCCGIEFVSGVQSHTSNANDTPTPKTQKVICQNIVILLTILRNGCSDSWLAFNWMVEVDTFWCWIWMIMIYSNLYALMLILWLAEGVDWQIHNFERYSIQIDNDYVMVLRAGGRCVSVLTDILTGVDEQNHWTQRCV